MREGKFGHGRGGFFFPSPTVVSRRVESCCVYCLCGGTVSGVLPVLLLYCDPGSDYYCCFFFQEREHRRNPQSLLWLHLTHLLSDTPPITHNVHVPTVFEPGYFVSRRPVVYFRFVHCFPFSFLFSLSYLYRGRSPPRESRASASDSTRSFR